MKISELSKALPPSSSSTRPPVFSYPHTLHPVPCFNNLQDLSTLQNTIIPLARTGMTVQVPIAPSRSDSLPISPNMQPPIEPGLGLPANQQIQNDTTLINHCQSDGILFYVSESSYETGPSLLAAWVPLLPLEPDGNQESPLEKFARQVQGLTAQ